MNLFRQVIVVSNFTYFFFPFFSIVRLSLITLKSEASTINSINNIKVARGISMFVQSRKSRKIHCLDCIFFSIYFTSFKIILFFVIISFNVNCLNFCFFCLLFLANFRVPEVKSETLKIDEWKWNVFLDTLNKWMKKIR